MKNKGLKVRIAGIICLFVFTISAQTNSVLFCVTPNNVVQFQPTLTDEFSEDVINSDNWYGYYPWGGVSLDAGIYTSPKNATQSNGMLRLKIDSTSEWHTFPGWMLDTTLIRQRQIPIVNGQVLMKYHTAALWSKEAFKYGYFECRCKMPIGQGLWPAFWLYGGKPNEEIDILEGKGEKAKAYHVDVHCPNRCDRIKKYSLFDQPFGHWVKNRDFILNRWVHFSGHWTPEGLAFFINGERVASHQANLITQMNLIANLSMAQDKGPFSPGPNKKTAFPSEFQVDYMRAWQLESDAAYAQIKLDENPMFISVVEAEKNWFYVEFLGPKSASVQVELLKNGQSFAWIDSTVAHQWVCTEHWAQGTYEVRCKSGSVEKKTLLVKVL